MLWDIHCHILPEVDDGAKSPEISKRMLECAKKAGITHIIATPHMYDLSDAPIAARAYEALKPVAASIGIKLYLGFEVNWRVLASRKWDDLQCCLGGSKHLLLSLPSSTMLPNWEYVISDMSRHITPVIAHPERMPYFQRDFDNAMKMRETGCEFQIDAEALCGSILSSERRLAYKFIEKGIADYISSDAHSEREYAYFERARKKFAQNFPMDASLMKEMAELGA